MKVMTIFGTRPEIIRLSIVMRLLDQYCEHTTVHTGQNFDRQLSDIFLNELQVREPDENLGIRSTSFGAQAGRIIELTDAALERHRPDRVLILGDTNSGLSAVPAARRGIPVFHMEAGNRCFDDRVPEEVNRRIIDHSSKFLLPYTESSRRNLLAEGIDIDRIFVTGNPIYEVLRANSERIDGSTALDVQSVGPREYFLSTIHRAENVDDAVRLEGIMEGMVKIAESFKMPVLVSLHPRTAEKLDRFGLRPGDNVRLLEPLGFFDFVKLEQNAFCVLTDSGTVQEECAIFRVPNVTVRDVTERPETVECGSNILSGADPASMLRCARIATAGSREWNPPDEYLWPKVSQTVAKIVLGHSSYRKH